MKELSEALDTTSRTHKCLLMTSSTISMKSLVFTFFDLDVEIMRGDVVLQNTAALETDRTNTRKTDRASEKRRGWFDTYTKETLTMSI